MKTPTYRITLDPDDNGTLLVTSDSFPELATYGRDPDEAVRNARLAIEEAIAARISDGRAVPPPLGNDPVRENEALVALTSR